MCTWVFRDTETGEETSFTQEQIDNHEIPEDIRYRFSKRLDIALRTTMLRSAADKNRETIEGVTFTFRKPDGTFEKETVKI